MTEGNRLPGSYNENGSSPRALSLIQHVAVQAASVPQKHEPKAFIFRCIDSRLLATDLMGLRPNDALIHTSIGGLIPPAYEADDDLLAKLALAKVYKVTDYIILAHGDCGGAHVASDVCCGQPVSSEKETIFRWINRSGLSASRLREDFIRADQVSKDDLADAISRRFGVQSLHNFMGYDGIEEAIKAGEMNVVLLYKDMKAGRMMEYDVGHERWKPLQADRHHFCARSHCGPTGGDLACGGCATKTAKGFRVD